MPDNLLIISTNMRELLPAMFRLKAEMCRLFADTADNVMRELVLLDLADYWDKLAKASERLAQATSGPTPPPPRGARQARPDS